MRPVGPFHVAELFPDLHAELLALLRSLAPEDWERPTAAGAWRVRDIVAHLLDVDIRRLSFHRDRAPMVPPDTPIESYRDLVAFLDRLNAEWVRAARRISPQLLVAFHEMTGPEVSRLFAGLDPHGEALFPVAWAGESGSENWFDVARELTERWHHQQQIRDAVGAPPLYARRFLHPVLDAFLRGLPHTWRKVEAEEGASVVVEVTGEAGGVWTLVREAGLWRLYEGAGADPAAAAVRMDQDTAWRLLTKGLKRDEAARRVVLEGRPELGSPILGMLSVMA